MPDDDQKTDAPLFPLSAAEEETIAQMRQMSLRCSTCRGDEAVLVRRMEETEGEVAELRQMVRNCLEAVGEVRKALCEVAGTDQQDILKRIHKLEQCQGHHLADVEGIWTRLHRAEAKLAGCLQSDFAEPLAKLQAEPPKPEPFTALKFTPLHLRILLHYYYCDTVFPDMSVASVAASVFRQNLQQAGLISGGEVTEMGKALVEQLITYATNWTNAPYHPAD